MKIKTSEQYYKLIDREIKNFLKKLEVKYCNQDIVFKCDDELMLGKIKGLDIEGWNIGIDIIEDYVITVSAKVEMGGDRGYTSFFAYREKENEEDE